MTILELITEFCGRRGLDAPGSVVGSTEQAIIQLKGLANECVTDLTTRGASWEKLQKQATFTTVAQEDQGAMVTIAPFGFKYIMPGTFFDRTQRVALYGPRNGANWQANEALPNAGPFANYRVWQNHMWLQPAPPAGHSMAFEYASDMAILDTQDGSWKKRFTKDTDVFQLDEDLLLAGLNWRWRREQGLSYSQEKVDYEIQVTQAIGTENRKGEVNMGGGEPQARPGIIVPSGNWNVQ